MRQQFILGKPFLWEKTPAKPEGPYIEGDANTKAFTIAPQFVVVEQCLNTLQCSYNTLSEILQQNLSISLLSQFSLPLQNNFTCNFPHNCSFQNEPKNPFL